MNTPKKATGIVRHIDDLGRIVIPSELRRTFQLPEGSAVEIFTQGDEIILHKYAISCIFCGSNDDLIPVLGQTVCPACMDKLRKGRR